VMKMKIGIWGISGFVGTELAKLFSKRPEVEIVYTATSEEITGKIENVEVGFLALKEKQSIKIAPELLESGIKVIDLSGAFRIKDASDFTKHYQLNHAHPDLLDISVYGLPEKNREKIRNAQLIANPGCYPTAIDLGLLPLLDSGLISSPTKILAKAISGYTGAGKEAKIPKTITPYKGGRQHQHIPEIEQELDIQGRLLFFPQVAPWPRGIVAVIYVKISAAIDILNLYKQFYGKELFIRVKSKKAEIDDVVGTNFCDISPAIVNSFAVIRVVIDNLGKGAAGQSVQNFNILCGFPEELVY